MMTVTFLQRSRLILTTDERVGLSLSQSHLVRGDKAKPFVNSAAVIRRVQYDRFDPLLARPLDDLL